MYLDIEPVVSSGDLIVNTTSTVATALAAILNLTEKTTTDYGTMLFVDPTNLGKSIGVTPGINYGEKLCVVSGFSAEQLNAAAGSLGDET